MQLGNPPTGGPASPLVKSGPSTTLRVPPKFRADVKAAGKALGIGNFTQSLLAFWPLFEDFINSNYEFIQEHRKIKVKDPPRRHLKLILAPTGAKPAAGNFVGVVWWSPRSKAFLWKAGCGAVSPRTFSTAELASKRLDYHIGTQCQACRRRNQAIGSGNAQPRPKRSIKPAGPPKKPRKKRRTP